MSSLVEVSKIRIIKVCKFALKESEKRRQNKINKIADRLMNRTFFPIKCRKCALEKAKNIYIRDVLETWCHPDYFIRLNEGTAHRLIELCSDKFGKVFLDSDDFNFIKKYELYEGFKNEQR